MRVLYFHQHFSTPDGATGTRSYEMARALVKRGHSVTIVCGSYSGAHTGVEAPFESGVRRGSVQGIDVVEFELSYSNRDSFLRRSLTFLKFALRSIGVALKEPSDLIFATSTPLTAGIPGIVARWIKGKPFVFEVRDLWPELPREMGVITNPFVLAAMGILEWLSYRSATRLVGLSPGIVSGITRRGVAAHRVTMIPNASDLEIFAGIHEGWRPVGINETDLLAVFAGTHGIANGLDAVLDAAIELDRRGCRDVKIVLVGDGRRKERLIARAQKHGLSNVMFLPPVDKRRLAGLLRAADVGLQILANVPAFYYGTSPNKFFDYLAAGLPVLINYPGWLAETVSRKRCGFAIPPDDPNAFAAALIGAHEKREELVQMGERGRALAASEFSRSSLATQFAEWLEGAIPVRLPG